MMESQSIALPLGYARHLIFIISFMIYKIAKITFFIGFCSVILLSTVTTQRRFFQKNYISGNKLTNSSKKITISFASQLHEISERKNNSHYPFLLSILVQRNDLAGGGIEPPTFGL